MARFTAPADLGIVTCDGAELRDVIEVDTDLGFAVVADRDDAGNLVINGDEIALRLVLGVMTFTPTIQGA